jgi:hypothetical protein
MNKQDILREIKRTAAANGGSPLGVARFREATQIREADWFGKYWKNWGEALLEAGFAPNSMQAAYEEEVLIKAQIDLIREIAAFPVKGDLLLKRRRDPSFPSHNVFTRFGSKAQRVSKLIEYCRTHEGLDDVAAILEGVAMGASSTADDGAPVAHSTSGFVYLLKHGARREYKIGRTNNRLRREGEIAVELPEKVQPIHVIETDDPVGIERYWHSRFADKRKEGEWFALTPHDVRAFKRWRRIY